MHPGPFTLRELVAMAEAKRHEAWDRTAALMALAVNLLRDPKRSQPARPEDFHPLLPKPKKPILRDKELRILKDVFVREGASQ